MMMVITTHQTDRPFHGGCIFKISFLNLHLFQIDRHIDTNSNIFEWTQNFLNADLRVKMSIHQKMLHLLLSKSMLVLNEV